MSTGKSYSELKFDKTPLRVTPVTNYDPFEAKFCASLYWLVFRATEDSGLDDIPPQVTSPIERDAENRITVRPEVVELLTNDELYGKVCDCIFKNKDPVVGHWAVIQCLSRHGFYVVEEGDIAVTDSTLQQTKPFRKSTHLALMDALMAAYSSKVVTVPQVVQAVRKFSAFNASKELPFDLEDSLLLWINKVCTAVNNNEFKKQKLHAEDLLRDQDKAKRFRFRRDQLQRKVQTIFPAIDDLLKGVSDGQCLLGLVLFYHQDAVKIDDIHFGQDIPQENIVRNIELFRSLCSQYISTTALSLQVEDFMYSSHAMKTNLIALLAEMFYKCEIEEEQSEEDMELRSKSSIGSSEVRDPGIKDEISKNLINTRTLSAPMLASEIISARCPAVGKKLMDLAKEKNKQRSASTPDQLAAQQDLSEEKSKQRSVSTPDQLATRDQEHNTPRRTSSETRTKPNTQNRSYSLQLDFTDDRDTESNKENPFNEIIRKPVLASRKHSAPGRVVGGSPRVPAMPQPRLSKRSKQKARTLALEDWEMEDKDIEDIHVTDLQRSQSLTGLDNTDMEPRRSFHAWKEGSSSSDTNLDLKKSQRISLDFRPNHHTVTSSQAHERGRDKPGLLSANKYHEDRVSQDSIKSTDSLSNQPVFTPNTKDGYYRGNSQSCTSSMSERELKEFEEMEAMLLARRSNEWHKDPADQVSEEDVLNASVSSDDMNRFRLEVLQRLTEDKLRYMDEQGIKEHQQPAMADGNERVDNGGNKQQPSVDPNSDVSEELLSPINESSEPMLSLPETRASTPSTAPSSPCSPLEVAPFMPAFFMTSPANTIDKKAYKKSVAAKNKQDRKEKIKESLGAGAVEPSISQTPRFEMSPRNKSRELLARGSYTVDQMSIDAAKAAGIPVIPVVPVMGNERVSELTLSAAYRTTTRSLSVPEPLEDNQGNPIHDRVSISNSHLAEQGFEGRIPQQFFNVDSQSPVGSHAVAYGDQRYQGQENARQFSPRGSDDVVIFDCKTSEGFQDPAAHAHVGSSRDQQVEHNAVLTSSYVRQSYVDDNQGYVPRSVIAPGQETNPGQYGGSVGIPDDRLMNRETNYQEQFVAAVSDRLINQRQLNDEVDANHVRGNQDPSRNSFVSNTGTYIRNSPRDSSNSLVSNTGTYLRNSPRDSRNSLVSNTDPRNSFVGQHISARNSFVPTPAEHARNSFVSSPRDIVGPDVRNSFVGNQATSNLATDFRNSFGSSGGVDSSGNSAYLVHRGPDPDQEPRVVYSDHYGTYVKGAHPQHIPQGSQGTAAHGQGIDNQNSSPRQPGQFATFRKHPGSPIIQRQPSPGYHYEQHIPTNRSTVSYSTSQVTSPMSIGQPENLQYAPSARNGNDNYRMPTSQQYSSTGQAQAEPRHQSPSIYSNSPTPFYHNGSSTYRSQKYRPEIQQHINDAYHGLIADQHGDEPNFSPRAPQVQATQSPRTQANETATTQSPRIHNGEYQPRDSDVQRVGTPDRRSQAFTVDLDTGELKEMNSSTDSMSPRSPGSTILRSKTFKKGPEERVFDYNAKSLPGQQNRDKMSPQTSAIEPAVVGRNGNHLNSLNTVNSTSWSQSAEALMSVLHNGFPNENKLKKEERVSPSPRTKPGSSNGSSPATRINWLTAGLGGCGGQVMLDEKGEIENAQNKEEEEDTATTKHLAFLRLHFDEKRRQIEAEKRRSQEQWGDERRKLGETLFWYSIGRAQGSNNEHGSGRPEHEGSMRMNVNEPLKVITQAPRVTEYNGPVSSGHPTPPMGVSTPLECMSPVSPYPYQSKPTSGYQSPIAEGYQSPRNSGYQVPATFGHGYHQAPPQRPGYQSPSFASPVYQSPVSSTAGYQFPLPSQASYHSPVSSHTGYQVSSSTQPGYQSPISSQAGFQFPPNNGAGRQSSNGYGYQGNTQMQGYTAESIVRPNYPMDEGQQYETREFRLSEYQPQVTTPSQQSTASNEPLKSPSRRCWDVNSPTVPPSVAGFATEPSAGDWDRHEKPSNTGVQSQNNNDVIDDEDPSSKKAFSMFIGDEAEKVKEGLTPEQQKKRDRFLRNRQKKMEEERARRESENERKRQREQKQRELEIQERLEGEEDRQNETRRRTKQREKLARENGHAKPGPGSNQAEDQPAFADFSGPQCYVKPSGKSNRKLIINAISHVCLSGTVNNDSKERCLKAIAESQGFHFIILFKDGFKFRALYMNNPENEQSCKIYGIGPKVITSKMVECVYKYSSGSKEFIKIPSKSLSISVDGVAINKVYWQSNKPNVLSKTQSNLKRPPRAPVTR